MSQNAPVVSSGVLTYGSVELLLSDDYHTGEIVTVDTRLRLEVVDSVEKADGIIVLGKIPRIGHRLPSCICVLFTHYIRHPYHDVVDHKATHHQLKCPSERIRQNCQHAFMMDLVKRSVVSSLAYSPELHYL